MRKMKKLVGALLTVVMVLAMAVPSMASGLPEAVPTPEGGFTITIEKPDDGEAGTATHTYGAYQIFKGDLATLGGDKILSNVQWGDNVDGDTLLAALKANGTIGSKFTSALTAADVAKAMDGMTAAEAEAFAEEAVKHLKPTDKTSTEREGTYTITGLAAGYYLVKDDAAITGDGAVTKYILQVLENETVKMKASVPTVEKKVFEEDYKQNDNDYGVGYNDVADYDIGDKVPFKLFGTLPSKYADYDTYKYVFHDTLSEGLTYNNDAKVFVEPGHQDVTSNFDINSSGNELTVSINDLKTVIPTYDANTKVVVEYTAVLNKNAQIGLPGNDNKVSLEFSNNPYEEGTGKTPEHKVIVFTYELDSTKVDGQDKDKKLSNAEFVIYKEVEGTKYYATVEDGKVTGWTPDGPTINDDNTVTYGNEDTKLVSDADGLFKVSGLDDGIYYLLETKAPAGYNRIQDPIKLTIAATTVNGQDWNGTPADALTKLTIAVGEGQPTDGSTDTGIVTTDIENNQGATLPSTGGIGTTIFYVIGSILVLLAVVLLVTKRRMSSEE